MKNDLIENSSLGYIKLVGYDTENVPMWSINHYIEEFCNNYNKLLIIKRICELSANGAYDSQFLVAKSSASLFPTKSLENTFSYNNEKYEVLTTKSENPEHFWHIISNYVRPIVFFKSDGGVFPLVDFIDIDAIKITAMSYNSPVNIDISGALNGLVDLANAKNRREIDEERHISDMIGESANNTSRIISTYDVVNNSNVPEGIKRYANLNLEKLLERQSKLNEKLDIRIERINRKV